MLSLSLSLSLSLTHPVSVAEMLRRACLLAAVLPAAALQLGAVSLTPVVNGRAGGAAVAASTLWAEKGAIIFAVRRPG